MHILYIHQYFVPPDGSSGTRSYEMAKRLVRSGHRVTMITSDSGFPSHYDLTDGMTSLDIDGIQLRIFKVPYSNYFSFSRRILSFFHFSIKAVWQAIREKNVDLVFATSTPLTVAIPGIVGKIWHRCPMVFEVRDLWPEVPIAIGALKNPISIFLAKRLEVLAYRNSKRIVALSPGMANGVMKSGYPENKIEIIPNCCDVEVFRLQPNHRNDFLVDYPDFKNKRVVLYAGTMGIVNGVDYLVDIAREMYAFDKNICFLIFGDGRESGNVKVKAEKEGVLNKNFWMFSPVSKPYLSHILNAATVSISLVVDIPEMWNNSANKFFDSLAAGCPIVVNYGGWQAEFICNTGAGLVIPAQNPLAAAKNIFEFITDSEKLINARQAALCAADTTFNRESLAAQLESLLSSTLTSS
jgi:glycosyltransferase involved in cell wall biosynthesis